ncbi:MULTISPECIES: hypothetical protein [Eisenbergiella]|jgi:regulator of replication initiation timing|uniref:Uncharacterized protein n=1 Tax=Eisenbergiella massiliensis TaxID=1720294 RepID=A0A3E3HWH8_9FIRM|nr:MULTISPECIES: hypothetical protein [Eisenbergiella]RGE56180.1 hypothetical protein DXC51_25805 [Eisenbergiella massiliensis]DAN95586.1 MAG TPA: hypothetical protein [Caudoviricetes sp.]
MSTMIGMGAGKKAAKESDSKLRKENKELVTANKELQAEVEVLRYRISELEMASAEKVPEATPAK